MALERVQIINDVGVLSMCIVSNTGDAYRDGWDKMHPNIPYQPYKPNMVPLPDLNGVTKKEFEDLKKEVEELKLLLLAAKRFDEKTGQPECEMEEKVEFIKRLSEMLGVDMTEVFGENG